MLTPEELIRAVLVPAVVAAVIAAVGRWRGWAWLMPVALCAGLVAGYALFGVPRLPPLDGTDWLFWLAVPLAVPGVLDATVLRRRWWGNAVGAIAAGGAALLVTWALVPQAVSPTQAATFALVAAGLAAGAAVAVRVAEPRIGTWAATGALCAALGGAAVIIFSSNLRIVGIYGVCAAAACGAIVCVAPRGSARSLALTGLPLLAALLAGGHFYPDPGVSWAHVLILMASPALAPAGRFVPGRRGWVRGVVAVSLVVAVVAIIAVPTALKAKREAEENPYAGYAM